MLFVDLASNTCPKNAEQKAAGENKDIVESTSTYKLTDYKQHYGPDNKNTDNINPVWELFNHALIIVYKLKGSCLRSLSNCYLLNAKLINVEKNRYRPLGPERGAIYVVAAEQRIQSMGLPEGFLVGVFGNIKSNLDARSRLGFETDPTSREEVGGLVGAAMAENDHIADLKVELNRFVVGLLQTNEICINNVRSTSRNANMPPPVFSIIPTGEAATLAAGYK